MTRKTKKSSDFPVYKRAEVDKLIPYASNSRTHSPEQVGQLAASIKEFGFLSPIILDGDNGIIAGHGRLLAAQKLGMDTVPVIEAKHLTEAQRKAYVIADNQLALNAGWDLDLLRVEIGGLQDLEFDVDLLGFDQDFMDGLLVEDSAEGLIDEDEAPDVTDDPITVLGDVWILGDHRLVCGDATSIDAVDALMAGEKADLVFTDPPYNTGMTAQTQAGQGGTLRKGNKKPGAKAWLSHMFNDSYSDEEWALFLSDFCGSYDYATKSSAFIYVCLDWRRSHELVPELKKRWKFSNLIVWDKGVHGLGSDYKYTHEFIHVCKKGSPSEASNREGDREYQDVWRIQRKMGRDLDHATKKPIELCERGIRHGSKYKNIVLDLFGGSGSTLIASEKNNRHCRMMELDPGYCDVIIKRWQDFTGKSAVHESTQETYDEAKKANEAPA